MSEQIRDAVRCSPRCPSAWLLLSYTYDDWSQSVRRARFWSQMAAREKEMCRRLYQQQMPVAERAAELDPHHLSAWLDLTQSAAFFGDMELADRAFWHLAQEYPNDPRVYIWGLQLYQPKWLGDQEKGGQVAHMAAQAAASSGARWQPLHRERVAINLSILGYPELAQRVVRTAQERATLRRWEREVADEAGGRGQS